MSLDPQYPQGAGGLFRATSTSKLPAPLGHNVIESVPGTVPVGKAADGTLVTPTQSPVSGGGVASARAQNVMARGVMGSIASYSAAGSTFTYHTTFTVEQHARRFRVCLPNVSASAVSVAAVAIAVSNAIGTDPTVGGTGAARYTPSTNNWISVTFGGATSVTLPPAIDSSTGTKQPSWVWSDWIDIATIDRTDGGTLPVVMLRARVTNGVIYNLTGYNTAMWQTAANIGLHKGRYWTSYRYTGDGITTPSSFTYTTDMSAAGAFFVRLEYLGVSPGITLAVSGDSIGDGSVAGSSGNYGNGWAWQLTNLLRASRPDLPIELCLHSFSSTNAVSFPKRTERMILDGTHFDILFYSPFSPNDGAPNASTILAQTKYWQQINEMIVNGQFPLLTPAPLSVGASPYAYTAQAPADVLISGGTVSAVTLTRAGVSVTMPTSGVASMVDGDVLTVTYTVAPTMTVIPKPRQIGSKALVITTPCPDTLGAWDTTADAFRLAFKARILAAKKAGVPVIDMDQVLSDNATPARYLASMSTDGRHPNEAGHAAVAALGLPVVLPLLPTALA